jgi:hypothetical protein
MNRRPKREIPIFHNTYRAASSLLTIPMNPSYPNPSTPQATPVPPNTNKPDHETLNI